ncbi:hypothetical protein DB41_IT00070 [Neochlamydia sp. TUME1]|uniref:hypothetical protein n=1 Tax=Neochlamydia sp. TUME1 TaxID=1478174 RepID=UPI00058010E8|nr:hypothetical protein [Neochlamydia sp. TUME1]KIC74144.1 hypothetical protein DB41_IT00070 [Neochlamydia sp. TUME1]
MLSNEALYVDTSLYSLSPSSPPCPKFSLETLKHPSLIQTLPAALTLSYRVASPGQQAISQVPFMLRFTKSQSTHRLS